MNELQRWIYSLSTLETWVVGGLLSIVLWCGIVLPFGYRIVFVPLGLPGFWQRVRQQPSDGVLLVLMLLIFGPATVWIGFVALFFLLLTALLKVLFSWVLRGARL